MLNRENGINLRVFKRNSQYLLLLWNRGEGRPNKGDIEILFREKDSNNWTNVENFDIDDDIPKEADTITRMQGTIICGINEKSNDIVPSKEYEFEVTFKDHKQNIVVKPSGILPSEAREDKNKDRHMFGWNEKKNKWQKLSVIEMEDGTVAIPVKVVK